MDSENIAMDSDSGDIAAMEAPKAVPDTNSETDKVMQEEPDPSFKKPDDPFKVPILVKAKGAGKPSTGAAEPARAAADANDSAAPAPGGMGPPSARPAPLGGPGSEFMAPSSAGPRPPATTGSKVPKGSSSAEFATPKGPLAATGSKVPKGSSSAEFATPKDPIAATGSKVPKGPAALPAKGPNSAESATPKGADAAGPAARSPVAAGPAARSPVAAGPAARSPAAAGPTAQSPAAAGPAAPAPYRPPPWSGCPPRPYALEVLRGGRIVDTVPLGDRACVVFGRLPDCDVRLEHPSISRHHAALVYRMLGEDGHEAGYYLFDLGSTHGSTLNKTPVQPKVYCRVRVGHICKFGGSTRLFILQGPDEDRESESELTVTELKAIGQERQERQQEHQERLDRLEEQADSEAEQEKSPAAPAVPAAENDGGISWGMTEDADEASDLQFNPFALGEAENEQLYLVDPKKTLRGWFEREGHELEYQTEELKGGKHICRVTLPLETVDGRPPVAEAQHLGKKKEAVFQCALEACRLLDRAGVLRQAKQESRQKRRQKPTGYDSDEDDTFLDRTGAVERKRQRRQEAAGAAKTEQKADTYPSLLLQYQRVQSDALAAERRLKEMESAAQQPADQSGDVDELDAFMTSLSHGAFSSRQEKRRLKTQLTQLRAEEGRLCRLVNLARPASMPALKLPPLVAAVRSPLTGIIGKKKQVKPGGAPSAAPRAVRGPAGPERKAPAAPALEEEDEDGEDAASSPAPREDGAKRLAPGKPDDADSDERMDTGSGREPSESVADRGVTAPRRVAGPDRPPAELSDEPAEPDRPPAELSDGPAEPTRPPAELSDGPAELRGPAEPTRPPAELSDGPSKGPAEPPRPGAECEDPAGGGGVRQSADSEREAERSPDRPAVRPADNGAAEGKPEGVVAEGTAVEDAAEGVVVEGTAVEDEPEGVVVEGTAVEDVAEASAPGGPVPPEEKEVRLEQPAGKAKRKRPARNRRKDKQASESYSELAGDGTYDVWMPPEGQSGDGRTSLNDKFGY